MLATNGRYYCAAAYGAELSQADINALYNNRYPVDIRTLDTVADCDLSVLCGDRGYWDGSKFIFPDEVGGLNGQSVNMEESDLKVDAPAV